MPDKKYLIEIPDMPESSGVWDADKWERNKDKFMQKYPDANIFEVGQYDPNDMDDNDQFMLSFENDADSSGVWDAAKWERNKEAFMAKYPEAHVDRVRYVDYWGNKAQNDKARLEELQRPDEARNAKLAEMGFYDDLTGGQMDFDLDAPSKIGLKPLSSAIKQNSVSGEITYLDPKVEEFMANDTAHTERQMEMNRLREEYDRNPRVVEQREYEAQMARYAADLEKQIKSDMESEVDVVKAARGASAKHQFGEDMTSDQMGYLLDRIAGDKAGSGAEENEKLERYNSALKLLQQAKDAREVAGKGLGGGIADTAKDWVRNAATQSDIEMYNEIGNILTSLERKVGNLNEVSEEDIENNLSNDEKALIRAFFEYNAAMADAGENMSTWYKGGKIFAESIPFMLEFLATGGLATGAGRAATSWMGKGFAKWIAKSAKGTLARTVKKGVAKSISGVAKTMVAAGARTLAAPSTYKNIAEQSVQYGEDGHLDRGGNMVRAAVDSYIEQLSEMSGAAFGEVLGGIGKLALGKTAFNKIGAWFGNNATMQTLSRLGFHGLPEEVGEEIFGNALRTITGVDNEALSRMFEKDEFASMIIGFAPMTLIGAGTSAAQMGAVSIGAANAGKRMRHDLSRSYTEEQIDQVVMSLDAAKDANQIAEAIKPIITGMAAAGAPKHEIQSVWDYAIAVAKKKAMISAQSVREMQLTEAKIGEVRDAMGERFWIENEDGTRDVKQITLNNGNTAYVVSKPDQDGRVAIINADTGQKGTALPEDIKEESWNGTLNAFGAGLVMADRTLKEQQRMQEERKAQITEVQKRLSVDPRINVGTEGSPVNLVVQSFNDAGVRYVAQDGSVGNISWEQAADSIGMPIVVKTDAQIAQEEADALVAAAAERRAKRAKMDEVGETERNNAVIDAENAVAEGEQIATHIPMNEDGTVNEAAFWEQSPEEYVKWNDEQNKDGGQDSLQQVAIAKQELMGLLQEANAAQNTSNPTTRKAAKKEVERLADRIARLDAIEQSYMQSLEEEKEAVQQTAATPTATMNEEQLEKMDTQYQGILGKTRIQSERVRVMQEYLDKLAENSAPIKVLTKDNYEEVMRAAGCPEEDIKRVGTAIRTSAITGAMIAGFASNGVTFVMADTIADINSARITYIHERQHLLNSQNSDVVKQFAAALGDKENALRILETYVGKNGLEEYKNDPIEKLADEIICRSMEIVYSTENYSVDLQNQGLSEEAINIINTIDNGQRTDKSLSSARRSSHANLSQRENAEENGRNSEQVSGGILGEQEAGSLGSSGRGDGVGGQGSTGEGAEVDEESEEVNPAFVEAISTDVDEAEYAQFLDDKAFADPQPIDGIHPDDVRFSIVLEDKMRGNTQAYFDKHYNGGKLGKKDQKLVPLNVTHFTQVLLDAANAQIEEMRKYMLPYLDMESKGKRFLPAEVYGKSTLFDNSSYGKTMENTLICTRTLAYIDFVEEVKKRIGRPLTATESFLASQMLYDIAIDPQCLYCYVSLDRKAYDEFLLRYIQQRDEVISKWNASDKSAEAKEALYKEFLAGRKPTSQMQARFESWLLLSEGDNAITPADLATKARRGDLKISEAPEAWEKARSKYQKLKGNKKLAYAASEEYQTALWNYLASPLGQVTDAEAYAQSASWAKKEEDYRSYTGELLKCTADALKGLMGHYGLRFYSFSEYSPAFILENMQMVRDAAARGLKGFAYTKEIDFIKIFAPTGMNINCSVYGRVDSEGNVVPDIKQGADWAQVQALREQYPNVGAVFVATNDEMVEWALNQPWIDVIIPFHIVRTGADIAKFYEWTNYSSMQADTAPSGKTTYIFPHEHHNDKTTFLKIAQERGLSPRFADVKLADGRSIVEHPNYMRLVNETRRSVDETPILTPTFNVDAAKESFDAFVAKGGYYSGYFYEDEAFEQGIETVVEDIKAGKTAKDVDYGRQDVPIDVAKIMAKRAEMERKHGKSGVIDLVEEAKKAVAREDAKGDVSFRITPEMKEIKKQAEKDGTFMKAPNGQPTNLSEEQWLMVRTKNFIKWFGDWLKPQRIEKLRNSEDASINGDEIAPAESLDKKAALEYGKKLQGFYTNKDTGASIQLQRGRKNGGVNEVLQHNYKDAEHLQSIAAIPQIIEKSIFIESAPNADLEKNPDVVEYQHFVCGLKIGGEDYTVHSLVAVDKKGDRYYDHNLTAIEKKKLLDLIESQAVEGEDFGTTPGTQPTILSTYKGKQLVSLLQVDASKVVDANGEPKVVYHQTNQKIYVNRETGENWDELGWKEKMEWDERDDWEDYWEEQDFNTFSRVNARTTNEFDGFFFAPEYDENHEYGDRTIAAFVNIKNPASREDYNIDSRYNDAGRNERIRLQEAGFDGVIRMDGDNVDEYIAFEPNQIKSATDNNGDFNPNNNDIRFRVTAEQDKAYMDAVKAGDLETAQRMVDEAARLAGYDSPKLYHGTRNFGFTKADVTKSDDGISFFATTSPSIAKTYSSVGGERRISDKASTEDRKAIANELGEAADDYLLEHTSNLAEWLNVKDVDAFALELTDMVYGTVQLAEEQNKDEVTLMSDLMKGYDAIIDKYYDADKYASSEEQINNDDGTWDNRMEVIAAYGKYIQAYNNPRIYGNYTFYATTWAMEEIDCKGANWNNIKSSDLPQSSRPWTTRKVARFMKEEGWKGVILKNIVDLGGRANIPEVEWKSNIYIFFEPQWQVKSADPVTYDDNGKVIPLSERFNPENADIRFRMRGENESAKEFTDSIVKDFKDDYNAVAPIEIVDLNSKEDVARFFNIPAEDITDDDIQFIKNDVEKKDIWAAYHPDLKKIVIFVRDSLTDSKKGELALIHENIHAINGKYPEFLALGEYLWNRVEEGTKEHKYKTAIQKFYPEHKWHDELSAYVVSEHMQNGTLDELRYILDLEHTNILNKILNTSGYGKERKSDRAGFFRNVLRKRSSGKVGRASEKKGGASELTAEERRIIGEYFPEFNKTEDVRMRVNSQGKELTEGQEEFFANSKAVDKDGNLLVLYHGTPRAGFTEFKSGWFTTSKEDAISYSGDRKGRLFDPDEKYEPETLTAGDFRLGYMTFDSEEDRAAFLERFPYADEVMSEREYEDARMRAEDEEYDALTARRKEFAEVWNAYREYERERFVDTTVGDLIANPEAYTEEDLMRAMLEYDSNATFDNLDDMSAEERKDALVSALQNANEETEGGILDMVVPTRVPRNGEGLNHNDLGNRTYEVYANVENPYEIDANGRGSEFESGDIYKAVEEALADERYDGVIVRNWRVGRYQQLGDVVVPKNGTQVKLTSNENPTGGSDIVDNVDENGVSFRVVTDQALLDQLNNEEYITLYRAMQIHDGGLYQPMAGKVAYKEDEEATWGDPTPEQTWLQSDETPWNAVHARYDKDTKSHKKEDLKYDKDGNPVWVFKLDKGNGKSLYANYNPYIHTSFSPLNDQFSEAQDRGNLVVVRVLVPKSELTSGYKAEKAHDAVGTMPWHSGPISGVLAQYEGKERVVMLTRYAKIDGIVPWTEVANEAMNLFKGTELLNNPLPTNVFMPGLREELEKRGVQFVETNNKGEIKEGPNKGKTWARVYGKDGLGKKPKDSEVRFRFSPATDEIDLKAMRGISALRAFNVSFQEMRKIFFDIVEETEETIKQLREKENRTAYDDERLARAQKELEAAHRKIDWWESVNSQLVDTTPYEPNIKETDLDLEARTPAEYIAQFLTMQMTRVNKLGLDKKTGKTVLKKVNKRNGVMLTQETLKHELGWGPKDWAGFKFIMSETEGKNLDEIAQMISEDSEAQLIFVGMGTMEIKDAVIDFLQSVSSYTEIRDYVKNERIREAKELADYVNARKDAVVDQIETSTGMSVEEYNDRLVKEELKAIDKELKEVEISKIYGKFEALTSAENEAYQQSLLEGAETGVQEGDQVLPDYGDGALDTESSNNAESQGDSRGTDSGNVGDRASESGRKGAPAIGRKAKGLVQEPMELSSESAPVDEVVNTGKQKAIKENIAAGDIYSEKIQKLNNSLAKLRSALAAQREYDVNTVKIITGLANELLQIGRLTDMSRGEIKRLLSVIKDATGKEDLSVAVERLMDIMIGNQLRSGKSKVGELMKVKASKVNASGVEVRGSLDVVGQQMMQSLKEGIDPTMTDEQLAENIATEENNLDSDSAVIRKNAENRLAGYYLARQYREDILASEAEEKALRKEIEKAKEQYDAGQMDKTAYKEFVKSCYDAIRENRMQRVTAYEEFANKLAAKLAGSIINAKSLNDAEKARVEQIHHFANSDMQGMPSVQQGSVKSAFWNNPILRFLFKPLATFDQMLRSFAPKSRNGEGYLWKHFMGGWLKATENEYKGVQSAHERLDEKVRSVFPEAKRWSDLFSIEKKMPKMQIKFWDGEKMADFELTQGNLLYIYMVNKMTDGQMKLRKMGITDADVADIARKLDPRLLELADWIQDSFLPSLREKYNAVHERLFGAPMAAIDNYFPIRVLANARTREVDVNIEETSTKASTVTGSIIKRTKNSLALDILGSDAFDVVLEHVEQMEKWAAFAEFNKDLNTLLSYNKFRNRVQNTKGIYGTGVTAWNNFRATAELAAGVYKPAVKSDSIDKMISNIAKGVTGAKISYRVYTALKQFLSAPAFVSDASPVELVKALANPYKAWKWAMENLPLFEKRWKSRQAGDSRLMETDADWQVWKSKIVELAGRYGMTPNAFVDALTVSMGAKAIYETKRAEYMKQGYSLEKAEEKAKRDATVLFNESQQSNEAAFLSTAQVDRTIASIVVTVFRNSSMGYQRMYVDALRNIKHMLKSGYKEESIEYMTKQMVRDGLTEEQAARAAERIYNRSFAKNAVRVATFGFLVQFAWNLGPYMAYLLMGDDDEEKKDMLIDAAVRGFVGGPVEGLAAGQAISSVLGDAIMGEKIDDPTLRLPAASDMEAVFSQLDKDPVRAINDIFNFVIQSGVGVNPQTITDAVVAIVDACNGDLETSKEVALAMMRVLQTPQSQIEKLYMENIDFTAEEALDMSIKEFAERYAKYKVTRNAPLTKWMYDDEREKELEDRYIKTFTKKAEEMQRTHGTEEAQTFFEYYDSEYEEMSETLRDLKKQIKSAAIDEDKEAEQVANKQIDDFLESEEFKRYEQLLPHIKAYEAFKKALKTAKPEERENFASEMIKERNAAVELLNSQKK